jgi:uncharacterized protein YigA (DUF484 family)
MARKADDLARSQPLPSAEQVTRFLRSHPDFLTRHPELLLSLPALSRFPEGGPVVDMQAVLIERLKGEIARVRGAAEDLIHTSRSNMSTQNRTHDAVVRLLATESIAAIAETVADDLPALLDVDVATLCFEESSRPLPELAIPGVLRLPEGTVAALLKGLDRDCALYAEMPGDPLLFGDGNGLVMSSAVVRLSPGGRCPPGVLALGSRHGETFHCGQGTELLNFLARVTESCLRRFLL